MSISITSKEFINCFINKYLIMKSSYLDITIKAIINIYNKKDNIEIILYY